MQVEKAQQLHVCAQLYLKQEAKKNCLDYDNALWSAAVEPNDHKSVKK